MISYFKQLLTIALLLAIIPAACTAALYVVVSNNFRGLEFSAAEIKRILLGEITSIKDQRVRLVYPSYDSREIVILSKFVGKGGSVRDLKSYWSKMIFTGRGNPPETAENEGALKKFLSEDSAIGVSMGSAGMNVIFTIPE